jgi:hypothetical protein
MWPLPCSLPLYLQAGLRVTPTARSLGVSFASAGLHGIDWQRRMQHVRRRLQRIANIPCLSAFGRAFAVNAYALSTLLYGAQYACAIPAEHATCLVKWSAAVVGADLGPGDDMRRPPGIPTSVHGGASPARWFWFVATAGAHVLSVGL